jgi:hypothetical protein
VCPERLKTSRANGDKLVKGSLKNRVLQGQMDGGWDILRRIKIIDDINKLPFR